MEHASQRHGIDAYQLKFSGTGGEYFRVWIVNVLLSILTLGLYTPWARRRTARYFYDHTLVAGSPLEFAAPLRKMVMGFLVFFVLYIAYQIASESGQTTAVNLFIVAAAVLAPYVWGSAMRFRLASTRWRGLQLHFGASWKEVYLASWPVFAMAAIWLTTLYAIYALTDNGAGFADLFAEASAEDEEDLPLVAMDPAMWGLVVLAFLLSVLCVIRLEFNYRSLLVLRGGIGSQRGRWKPVYGDFVKIWAATIGVFLLGVIFAVILFVVVVGGSAAIMSQMRSPGLEQLLIILVLVFVAFVALLLVSAPARAYREARMFQLIWNNVGLSQIARFRCTLRPWAYVRLRMKNLLLTILTLGFYRAFARTSEYRMRVDSVTLHVKGGLDQLVGQLTQQQQSGLGDALADAAGLDLIG